MLFARGHSLASPLALLSCAFLPWVLGAPWQPPEPAAPWQGVLDATQPGRRCPQLWNPMGRPQTERPEHLAGDEEDCLTLNVYTPWVSPRRLRATKAYLRVQLRADFIFP